MCGLPNPWVDGVIIRSASFSSPMFQSITDVYKFFVMCGKEISAKLDLSCLIPGPILTNVSGAPQDVPGITDTINMLEAA